MDAQRDIQPTGNQLCEADNVSDWFWDIIRRADKDRTKLEGLLRELPVDDIRRFALEFHDASSALWSKPYTGYLTYRSEDDIADVSYWIVSQGKDMYVDTCAHSEKIATYEAVAHADQPTLAFVADGILDDYFDSDWNLDDDYQTFADSGYSKVSDFWEARRVSEQ